MSLVRPSRMRRLLFAMGAAFAALGAAAAPAFAAEAPPPQTVLLRVQVGADGKVVSAKPLDPDTVPVILQAAQQVAGKLSFTPASKDGRAVPSETSLVLTLGFEPKDGGGYGISLRRALNGPSVVAIGKAQPPKVPKSNGGLVVIGADLRADGSVDAESFKVEKVELRVPSQFDQSQYEKVARLSLKDTRFMLDKLEGVEVPARIAVSFMFNGGPASGKDKDAPATPPALTATSRIEGIVLPKIDYTAPGK